MKYFSFNKNRKNILITLLIVSMLGAAYFFMYVPQNEQRLQEQRFRSLQNVDINIHARIDNSVVLMNMLMSAYKINDPQAAPYMKAINSNNEGNFLLTFKKDTLKTIGNKLDSGYIISLNNYKRKLEILIIDTLLKNGKIIQYTLNMQFNFQQFIKMLLPSNVFEQYIIFSGGNIIYQDFPSGIGYLGDSLSGKVNGVYNAGIKSLAVSGKSYKLFSLPVSITTDKQLIITGLLSNSNYQHEKNQLPSNIVLFLLTVVFLAIVAYPWIKLYQMGNTDRLTVNDGVATIVVSMLLMSLVVFTFVKYNLVFRPDTNPNSKDTLSAQITKAFKNEVSQAYKKLNAFNTLLIKDSSKFSKKIIFLGKSGMAYADDISTPVPDTINTLVKGLKIDQVFWLDSTGQEKINWISGGYNAPYGNFKKRPYFKNIIQSNSYFLNNDTAKKYYLDQVISWTTGAFSSVLSLPSRAPGVKVACISFGMKSLQNPVLPAGYQFAIIDENAKVLYHSQTSRNLNENMLSEFSPNNKLKSCIEARVKDNFKIHYFSREYEVTVEPIQTLPYFIVIFEDSNFKEIIDVEIYSFTFSMMLLLFAFLIFQLFTVFLASSKRSFFKKQKYETSWIGPKISAHNQYNTASLANLTIILLAILFFRSSTMLSFLFILLLSITFAGIFLNFIFALRYKKNNKPNGYRFKKITIICLIIFSLIINRAAFITLDTESLHLIIIFQLVTFVALTLIFFVANFIIIFFNKNFSKFFFEDINFAHSFSLMVLTRLMLSSGLPVLFFYMASYNYEKNVSIRYQHLQYARHLPKTLTAGQLSSIKLKNNIDNDYYYYDGAWVKDIFLDRSAIISPYSKEEYITIQLLSLFRINFSEKAINQDKFYAANAADSSFFYNPLLKNACKGDSATITYIAAMPTGENTAIRAANLNYKLPGIFENEAPAVRGLYFNGYLFWLLLLMVLILFYFIIHDIINKIFCLKLPDLTLWNELDNNVLANHSNNNLVFVIGLPGSDKLSRIIDKIRAGGISNGKIPLVADVNDLANNVIVADFINIPDSGDDRENDAAWILFNAKVLDKKNKLIIVNHFEYNIFDPITTRIKLNFLERIMLANSSKIIILSTIHPLAFLEAAMEQNDSKKNLSMEHDQERWHVLLGHFGIVVFPLKLMTGTSTEAIFKSIFQETAYTHFLNKMRSSAMQVAVGLPKNKRNEKGDEMVLKLQVTADYFYLYIWHSLTKEEKFLLYDLAEDNLVNSYDEYNLNMLLAKGLIIRVDGGLRLFNRGFRNFILTAIGNAEAIKIKHLMEDHSNWSKLKNPLLIVIVAILIFLLASQEEVYSKLITYVAALGAAIPMFLKLFSMFDKTNNKS